MFTVDKDHDVTVELEEAAENIGEFAARSYFLTVQQVGGEAEGTATSAWLKAKQR
jgi:hypothetical protein